ncbi:HWE histidine kinase domain-containing protein [Falsiroseomonas sp.]|uniref:HWE histidine kinase domain-containing protein n=1 Tax=Falsiroseomonas sp. TaxID=2870721 RepID=UPI00356567A1
MDPVPAFGEADVSNCDREPIHIPGSVQPHGLLLVLHPQTLQVLQAGGDASLIAPATARPGQPLAALLPEAARAQLGRLMHDASEGLPRAVAVTLPDGRRLDMTTHRAECGVIVEFEALAAAEAVPPSRLAILQDMVACLQRADSIDGFCQTAVEEVRRVTGYDRVMIYRFEPDDSGVVVAEAREEAAEPYLGLHYPASDIPQQARALYLRNWLRIIPDARYVPAPLVPPVSPLTGAPSDLSVCLLRSVSPLHLEYLANMGVRATMTLSVIRSGELWGLIACHHATPRHVPAATRAACMLFAQMFSLQLEAKEQAAAFADAERMHRLREALVQATAREEDLAAGLLRQAPALLELVPAEGLALLVEGSYTAIGQVPGEAAVRDFAAWASALPGDGVLALDALAEAWPPAAAFAEVAAGALVLSVSREPRDCLIWFRPEHLRTVTWAGDPRKPVEVSAAGARLSPRRSFEAWRETVRGRSRPWRATEQEAAQALRAGLLEVVLRRLDQVAQERAQARERQDLLLAELDHRVKNTLANIQALVRHSSSGAAGLETFVADLHARLRAMAQAHSLLSSSRWEGAGLRSIAEEQLRPYLGGEPGAHRIRIEGPDVRLRPKPALALSLALHELATNAAKHGALSVPAGRVRLSWRIQDDRLLLDWQERGGPAVAPPGRRGFGTLAIERGLAYEVGGSSRLSFEPEGVTCRVVMPLRQVTEAGAVLARRATPAGLRGLRVLVVEDSALVAMEIESALRAEGVEILGPLARLGEALAALRGAPPDAALLDIDLDGVPVFPVADRLVEQGVPVLFTTGYEPRLVLPPRYATASVLAKPFRGEDVVAALRSLLALRPPSAT